MDEIKEICKICKLKDFKYVCPKCQIKYCSVTCYKSPDHTKCSEQFFRQCVQDELTLRAAEDSDKNYRKMQEILGRLNSNSESIFEGSNDENAGYDEYAENAEYDENNEYDGYDENAEEIDSDDDDDKDDCGDISSRLSGIDINNSDEIWKRLTVEERQDFKNLLENGEILKLVPSFDPWWNSVNLIKEVEEDTKVSMKPAHPKILKNILPFESISKIKLSTCLLHNISNVLASYTMTYRYLNGELQTNIVEAVQHLILLSANLKHNANFDNLEQAITSVIIEGQNENLNTSLEEYQIILKDVNAILQRKEHKLEALSDIYQLLKSAKIQVSKANKQTNCDREFSAQFSSLHIDFKKIKINNLIKKIEFMLSYVQSN